MGKRECIMGCKIESFEPTHGFPCNPKRRAEWCRILGVYPRNKRICICSAHFSDCYFLGTRLSRFAVPNPPELRKSNPQITKSSFFYKLKEGNYTSTDPINVLPKIVSQGLPNDKDIESEVAIPEPQIKNNLAVDPLGDNPNVSLLLEDNNEEPSQEDMAKVETFEIRKGTTNDTIIKGRFVQTKDYLVVTYTPPRKWTLQEQVHMLDKKCSEQLKQIRQLSGENNRLHRELKKHENLLYEFRKSLAKNVYFYQQLKKYKEKEAKLKKKRKERSLKSVNVIKEKENNIDT